MKDGGQQHAPDYARLNPQELVPTLVHDGHAIGQSLAIMEYLDEVKPEPPLLPKDPAGRARVRQLAYAVACDIHPVNNLRVLNYLRKPLGHNDDEVLSWYTHWIDLGLGAIETMLSGSSETGTFLSRRYAHAGRYLPHPADGECAARTHQSRRVPDAEAYREQRA